jgi:beta-galactosidase
MKIMRNYSKAFFICSLLLVVFNAFSQQRDRTTQSFNNNWSFLLDSISDFSAVSINDESWRKLNLPHDWSIEGEFSENNPATAGGGALPGGMGWYRKTFTIPETSKNKTVLITFDGVYRNSEVFINGHSLGVRPNGYISFQYDLTPYLNYGNIPNVIAVKVDNLRQPNSRWYSGSGIYRNVWLTTVDKVHVDNWGTYITTPEISMTSATVNIVTHIRNQDSINHDVTLNTTIYDGAGKQVGKASSKSTIVVDSALVNSPAIPVKQEVIVYLPKVWTIDNPHLYKAISQVVVNGNVTDTYETKFGIRSFNFDSEKGFLLNGKPVKILGVCDHHDLGALGAALNTRALERQLEILKGMGVNGIRTSHNPPAPELLDLCDKIGFIVMDEAFDMWAKQKTPYDYHLYWNDWHRKDLEDQILRDRNHPSVFIWSVGNEIPEQGDTSGSRIATELVNIVKALDTTREISTANDHPEPTNHIIASGAFDLIGYNYHHWLWDKFPQTFPGKKMIVTESTSALETRGHYDLVPFDTIRRWPVRWDIPFENPNHTYTVSAYDNVSTPWGSTHEESLKPFLKYNFISGMYIWTGFDYLGEPTPYSWPARSSYFGIVDLAGFPKDVYYLYQSIFTNKPVLHIYPHWNWNVGDTVDVVAYYNNADEVELFLNDSSLGKQSKSGDELHVKWRVPYQPGTLKAVSRKGGNVVLTREVKTADTATRLALRADRSIIKADGKGLSFITVTIVDKNGVMVPDANNLIKFTVKGAGFIAGVDSGDPTSHEWFKGNQHTALNGKALAIIQSDGNLGKIVLTAEADGLTPAAIVVIAK